MRTHPIVEYYQALRDSAPCLSRAATLPKGTKLGLGKRRAPGNTIILSQPYRRRVSTDRLNREGSQLAASLEGEPGPTPAGKTLPHSFPETSRFRRERAWYLSYRRLSAIECIQQCTHTHLASNQSSRAPSTHTVGRSSCKILNPRKYDNEESYCKVQGSAGEGVSQEDTIEGPLWRETLARSLESHDAAELVRGMCHGDGCRQETARLHAISCSKTGWSSLTHNRVLHQALARSLRESEIQFVVEDTWPFRERAIGQNDRLNPLRMDITTVAGAL